MCRFCTNGGTCILFDIECVEVVYGDVVCSCAFEEPEEDE